MSLVSFRYVVSCFVDEEVTIGVVDFCLEVLSCVVCWLIVSDVDGVIEFFKEKVLVFGINVELYVENCCCIIVVVLIFFCLFKHNLHARFILLKDNDVIS